MASEQANRRNDKVGKFLRLRRDLRQATEERACRSLLDRLRRELAAAEAALHAGPTDPAFVDTQPLR